MNRLHEALGCDDACRTMSPTVRACSATHDHAAAIRSVADRPHQWLFYALLSLGLAVIFGMLTIVNFAHGAFYMMGAFAAYFLLNMRASITGLPSFSLP